MVNSMHPANEPANIPASTLLMKGPDNLAQALCKAVVGEMRYAKDLEELIKLHAESHFAYCETIGCRRLVDYAHICDFCENSIHVCIVCDPERPNYNECDACERMFCPSHAGYSTYLCAKCEFNACGQ
jgi:hypothetical protein